MVTSLLINRNMQKKLIYKARIDTCKPILTPCKPHTQLLASEGVPLANPTVYRSLVGALLYLTFIRHDLSYSTNVAC